MSAQSNSGSPGGELCGVGIGIRQAQDRILIEVVAPAGPAEQVGVRAGDELYKVDDFLCRGQDVDSVSQRVRGPRGTFVVLHCGRGAQLISFAVPRQPVGEIRPAGQESVGPNPGAPIQPPWLSPPPSAPGRGASAAPGKGVKLNRHVIFDPQVENRPAFEYLLPEGWKSQGRIHWDHDSSLLATVQLQLLDPASGATVVWLPTAHFSFTPQPPMPISLGANWMGASFYPPPQHPADFVQMYWGGGPLAHLRGRRPSQMEDRPRLAEEFTRGQPGWRAQAVRLRYDYEVQGSLWAEDVMFVLNYAPQADPSVFNWNVQSAVTVRAPQQMLADRAPLFHVLTTNGGFTAEWLATFSICRQLFQQRMREWIIDNQRFGQQLAQYRDHISRLSQQMHEERMQSFDRIAASQREYLGGVETYRDPFDGRGVYLPAGYKDYWVNQKGEMLLFDEAGNDPNIGAADRWQKMDRIHPLEARWR